MLHLHVDAQALQSSGDVAPGPLAVVRQESEGDVVLAQFVDERIRSGNQMATTVDDAVHVDQVTKHQLKILHVLGRKNEPRQTIHLGFAPGAGSPKSIGRCGATYPVDREWRANRVRSRLRGVGRRVGRSTISCDYDQPLPMRKSLTTSSFCPVVGQAASIRVHRTRTSNSTGPVGGDVLLNKEVTTNEQKTHINKELKLRNMSYQLLLVII